MVTGTAIYVREYTETSPISKHSRKVANKFIINEIYLMQSYYWTKEWQEGEKEADEDIKHGRVTHFKNADNAIHHLRPKRKKGK